MGVKDITEKTLEAYNDVFRFQISLKIPIIIRNCLERKNIFFDNAQKLIVAAVLGVI